MQVTFADVIFAVSRALDAAFPDYDIAAEEIKQELKPPCFFLKLLAPSHGQELGRRFARYHTIDVHFFAADRKNISMYEMAEHLSNVLQWVEVAGRPVRGTGMRFEIVDEVLHFFVDYNFQVWHQEPEDPKMQTLEQQEGIK